MSRVDSFAGAVVVIIAVSSTVNMVLDTLIKRPDAWGAVLAMGNAMGGCLVIASVWRDRL